MSENDYNPEGLTEDQIRIKLLEEQATAQTQELSNALDRITEYQQRMETLRERWGKAQDDKFRAFEVIKRAVEWGEIEADASWLEEVAEIFGWELATEVSVSFTITGTATVKMPFGKTVDDLSFSADSVSITCDDDNNVEVDVEDSDLTDFDEQ